MYIFKNHTTIKNANFLKLGISELFKISIKNTDNSLNSFVVELNKDHV